MVGVSEGMADELPLLTKRWQSTRAFLRGEVLGTVWGGLTPAYVLVASHRAHASQGKLPKLW